jgi:RNA polymerase sigma factor (sigma-70 family)
MQHLADMELLERYLEDDSEDAFAVLVNRHVNLVYSAAWRKTGNAAAAEEITQAVFIILARKARGLSKKTLLSGWLYQTARFTAANYLKNEIRRVRREQEASMQSSSNESETGLWPQIAPLLEDALGRLGEKDRNAVVLRFFEQRSFQEVGAMLGATENAAKKRIARALEKLRQGFLKRGVVSTTAIIAGALTAHSVQAAPAAVATATTAAAIGKGAAAGGSTLTLIEGALKIMAWTKAKTAIVAGACVLLAAGTTTLTLNYEAKPMRIIRSEWSVISGDPQSWSFEGGKIMADSLGGYSMLASSNKYSDVTFSAIATSLDHYVNLAIRLQDANNGYIIVFAPPNIRVNPNGFVRLDKIVDGTQTTLASYLKQKVLDVGHSAKIKVVARGPVIEVYLNGDRVIRAEDNTFSSGCLGLRAIGASRTYPGHVTFSHVDFY